MTKLPKAVARVAALVGVLLTLALVPSAVSARATTSHAIRVLNSKGRVAVMFRSAKCSVNQFGFIARSRSAGYRLVVRVDPFKGFNHRYKLKRGHVEGTYIGLYSPAGVSFASDFVPPYPVPGLGTVNFRARGHLMGAGFHPMFSADGTDAVTVAGVLACKYKKQKR